MRKLHVRFQNLKPFKIPGVASRPINLISPLFNNSSTITRDWRSFLICNWRPDSACLRRNRSFISQIAPSPICHWLSLNAEFYDIMASVSLVDPKQDQTIIGVCVHIRQKECVLDVTHFSGASVLASTWPNGPSSWSGQYSSGKPLSFMH